MIPKKQFCPIILIVIMSLTLLFIGFQGCGKSQSEQIESKPECQVVGKFIEYRGPSPNGVYQMDIEIIESIDFEEAENPTKDKVGKKVTFLTAQYSEAILPGEIITAHVVLYEENGSSYLFASNLYPAVIQEK